MTGARHLRAIDAADDDGADAAPAAGRLLVTVHLPIDMGTLGRILQAVSGTYREAMVGATDDAWVVYVPDAARGDTAPT